MSALPITDLDRRFHSRTTINSQIMVKLANDSSYNTGLILDISLTGVLISLNHELEANTQITMLMESNQEDEAPIEIAAEIIRIAEPNHDHPYTYGCTILEVNNF